MGQGRAWCALAVLACLLSTAASAAAAPRLSDLDPALLAPSEAGARDLPAAPPLESTSLPGVEASAPAGRDLAATVAGALGAVATTLADAAGALARGLAGAGAALLDGLLAFLGMLGSGLVALGGLVAGALGALAAVLGGAAQESARAVARDPRLLAPVGGAAAVGGLAWLAHAGRLAPVAALFSRLGSHELLDHDGRRRIYEFIRERPGAHLSQVSSAMGLGWGATVYHLQRLRDAQLVSVRPVGNQVCHFVNGDHHSPDEQRLLAATKVPNAKAIVDFLKLRGPSTQRAIAEELGMSSALVSWHAKRLEELGVVQRARTGRTTTLALPASAARTAQVRPLPQPAALPSQAAA
jgi:Mn-dependent DtxR family transcriptional regulator